MGIALIYGLLSLTTLVMERNLRGPTYPSSLRWHFRTTLGAMALWYGLLFAGVWDYPWGNILGGLIVAVGVLAFARWAKLEWELRKAKNHPKLGE